jgi:CO/xanthine dehydrogenase Mo-binding subunit
VAIGRSERRVDAREKVTGTARYPADLGQPGDLFARIVFSGLPHARMLRMDTREAAALPGVVAILTARDVPRNEYGLVRCDQPVLVGVGGSRDSRVPADVSRWEADHIAVVIAETERAASAAAEAIRVSWEELPIVGNVTAAMTDATLVHPEGERGSNTYDHAKVRKGEADAALRAADVVVEGTYTLPHQEHAFLQPEAAVAYVDADQRITVEIAGQWAHGDQRQIAHALRLPPERIRVRYPAIGGAFGGREDASLQIVMALAAWRLWERGETRRIRAAWSREESILGHGKGHWMRVQTRWGATRSGRLTAVEARLVLDAGAYNYTSDVLMRNALTFLCGPYDVPNVRLDGFSVYTNNVPGAAFRGFGAPQACFAAESQMNRLACALGMDPIALRLLNGLREGSVGVTQTVVPEGVGLERVVESCAGAPVPTAEAPPSAPSAFLSLPADFRAVRTGRGFACGFKNVGYSFGSSEGCDAALEIHGGESIERVVVRCAAAEVGQGAHTVIRQMAAEALGVATERVELIGADTALAGDAGSASASRLTMMTGRAVLEAAELGRARWQAGERPARSQARFAPPPTDPLDPDTGKSVPHLSYGYVAESVELAVDVETGHLRISRVVCSDDVGRVINPLLARGQIEGGVAQAYGGAVHEELRLEDGRIRNPRLSEYLIPGIGDVPVRVESLLVETPDPLGPWGARGIGEMPFLPLAAAITAALHDATGVWLDELPLTPERVVAALRAHGVGPAGERPARRTRA